ncbi:MAG: hypoxanthine phosphoribosyltransferase [Candidatus Neomarinimicrobiota bacterium]
MKKILNKTLINQKVKNIGESISKKFIGKKPIFIGVLKGSFIFTADLLRSIKIDCEVEFIKVQSYKGTQSTGNVKIISDIKTNLKGRHIIVVEDIIDSGKTIKFLISEFKKKSVKSISIATFLMKSNQQKFDFSIDYIGFEIKQGFVVGYGLDFNQKYRNLDSVYVLESKN